MKVSNYVRTVGLNLLFVLLLPIILSAISGSVIVFLIYAAVYSLVEHSIDLIEYKKSPLDIGIKGYLSTVAFNILLLYGVSFVVQVTLIKAGIVATLITAVAWIMMLSVVELAIENRVVRENK